MDLCRCPVCANTEARGDQCEKCGSYLSPLELKNPRSKITGQVPVVRETTHLYFPLVEKKEYTRSYFKNMVSGYFGNSYKALASFFAGEEDLKIQELEEIRKLIDQEIEGRKENAKKR